MEQFGRGVGERRKAWDGPDTLACTWKRMHRLRDGKSVFEGRNPRVGLQNEQVIGGAAEGVNGCAEKDLNDIFYILKKVYLG